MDRITHKYVGGQAWVSLNLVSKMGENECVGLPITKLARYEDLLKYEKTYKYTSKFNNNMYLSNSISDCSIKELFLAYNSEPSIYINPDIKDFYDFTIDDISILNYEHLGKIKFPVSV